MAELGLVLILVGWLAKLYFVLKGDKEINMWLLLPYGIGVLLLVWAYFTTGVLVSAWLNIAILIPVAIILWKVVAK